MSDTEALRSRLIDFHTSAIQSPARACEKAEADLAWLERSEDHHILTQADTRYPAMLREITGAPSVLFVKGCPAALLQPQLAIVGSRACSRYGREVAMRLARSLSQSGFGVCSGLAAGIDTAAHQAVVALQGNTVAVLGNGVDVIYPTGNARLAEAVIGCGALVSEFPRNEGPRRAYFPQRNRVISGLSLGVVVVEATLRSGSLITARLAGEQNREVFAVPGSVNNPKSRGCHRLLREGAHLVETVEDIVAELESLAGFQIMTLHTGNAQKQDLEETAGYTDLQAGVARKILATIDEDPAGPDQLQQAAECSQPELVQGLLDLELKGYIECVAGGYRLASRKRVL